MTLALLAATACSSQPERADVRGVDAERDPVEPEPEEEEPDGPGDADAGKDSDFDECSSVSREAVVREVPVDILFIIDNSASMEEEILAVRQRINSDFAEIIAASGVDYRVIMLSSYGDFAQPNVFVCIDPPLSGRACDSVDEPFVSNGERFFHYNAHVDSLDGWCRLLDSLDHADPLMFNEWFADPMLADAPPGDWQTKFPHGIREVLREGAFKSIVLISDDATACESKRAYEAIGQISYGPRDAHDERFWDTARDDPPDYAEDERVAARFDRALTARAPEHFGTPEQRNYRFHAIVGIEAEGAVQPDAPLISSMCSTASTTGPSHQALSRLTGGLRYPICGHDNYDEIFHALARDSIASARLPCRYEIPSPPTGVAFDSGLVNVEYARDGEPTRVFPRVTDAGHCDGRAAWFYDDNDSPKAIVMCPSACSELAGAESGSVHIALGCQTVVL